MDTIIRKPIEKSEEQVPEAPKTQVTSTIDTGVEVPFSEYSREHGHPYSVDYFQLGDNWEVFTDEVGVIEDYIKGKIQSGEMGSSKSAVEKELKTFEKLHNLKDDERAVVKVGVISSYIKFLNDTKNIKKYANY